MNEEDIDAAAAELEMETEESPEAEVAAVCLIGHCSGARDRGWVKVFQLGYQIIGL